MHAKKIAIEALQSIAILDPSEDSEDGYNEWGEAECFNKAQNIARTALKSINARTALNLINAENEPN